VKQFITEAARLQKLAGINEARVIPQNSGALRQIWEKIVEDDREYVDEYLTDPEYSEMVENFEDAIENAKYGTIEELAESLNEAWAALADSNDEFGEYIEYLIRVCKEMNFKSTKELIRACIDNHYGDYYNEEEKEEEYEYYADQIGFI
jgi:hypothetical protein